MMGDEELEKRAPEFKLRPIYVQNDYVYGWLLKGISLRPTLASQLVLKGGKLSTRRGDAVGIFGAVAGIMGTLQATEIIKELLGLGDTLAGRVASRLRPATLATKTSP